MGGRFLVALRAPRNDRNLWGDWREERQFADANCLSSLLPHTKTPLIPHPLISNPPSLPPPLPPSLKLRWSKKATEVKESFGGQSQQPE
ncbi:MAG: hypothetical protein A2Y71_03410 [Bacteroidetes bacterium RBG_13_42_15]|nr:MAG: hypothetical protein A2Y71_03410 [Bacteroidetes bacterium RBG_13_42_15]